MHLNSGCLELWDRVFVSQRLSETSAWNESLAMERTHSFSEGQGCNAPPPSPRTSQFGTPDPPALPMDPGIFPFLQVFSFSKWSRSFSLLSHGAGACEGGGLRILHPGTEVPFLREGGGFSELVLRREMRQLFVLLFFWE